MKLKLIHWKRSVPTITALVFLLTILPGSKSYGQQTPKTDSTYALEGSQTEIDSVIKILNDYPDLKAQYQKTKQVLADTRKLTGIEQAAILKVLDLDVWDIKEVTKRIRRIKRRAFWRPILYGGIGGAVGFIVGFVKYNL